MNRAFVVKTISTFILVISVLLPDPVDFILYEGELILFRSLAQHLDLLLGLPKMFQHAALLEDCMRRHQVFPSFVNVEDSAFSHGANVDHQGADNLLSFGDLSGLIPVEVLLNLLHFLQLFEGFFKLFASNVDQSHVPLDLAGAHVLHAIRVLVNFQCSLQVNEGLGDLARLLLPSAQLSRDSSNEVRLVILFNLLVDTLSLLLIGDGVGHIPAFGMDSSHLQVDIADLLAVFPVRLSAQKHHSLEQFQTGVVVTLLEVNSRHDLVDLTIRAMVLPF